MVEWYWQRKTEVLGEKCYRMCLIYGWMSMGQWWYLPDMGKLKHWEQNTLQQWWKLVERRWCKVVEYWWGKTEIVRKWHLSVCVVCGWMIMEQWCYVTDRRELKLWEKILCVMGGRLLNECEATVGCYWHGKTEALVGKHYRAWVGNCWMSVEQWWNEFDRGKLKNWEKRMADCGW
jgi:hypothetical protein